MKNMPFNSWAYTGFMANEKPSELSWNVPQGTPPGNLDEKFVEYKDGQIRPSLHELLASNPSNSKILLQIAKYEMIGGVEVKCNTFKNNSFDVESEDVEANNFYCLFSRGKIGITPRIDSDIDKDYVVSVSIKEL